MYDGQIIKEKLNKCVTNPNERGRFDTGQKQSLVDWCVRKWNESQSSWLMPMGGSSSQHQSRQFDLKWLCSFPGQVHVGCTYDVAKGSFNGLCLCAHLVSLTTQSSLHYMSVFAFMHTFIHWWWFILRGGDWLWSSAVVIHTQMQMTAADGEHSSHKTAAITVANNMAVYFASLLVAI